MISCLEGKICTHRNLKQSEDAFVDFLKSRGLWPAQAWQVWCRGEIHTHVYADLLVAGLPRHTRRDPLQYHYRQISANNSWIQINLGNNPLPMLHKIANLLCYVHRKFNLFLILVYYGCLFPRHSFVCIPLCMCLILQSSILVLNEIN